MKKETLSKFNEILFENISISEQLTLARLKEIFSVDNNLEAIRRLLWEQGLDVGIITHEEIAMLQALWVDEQKQKSEQEAKKQ